MSASHAPALDAIAFQLAAALDAYEVKLDALVRDWPDFEGYREASDAIDDIRTHSAPLPELSVQFVALLIAHADVIHCLWQDHSAAGGARGRPQKEMATALEEHSAAVAGLRRRCLRILADSATRKA